MRAGSVSFLAHWTATSRRSCQYIPQCERFPFIIPLPFTIGQSAAPIIGLTTIPSPPSQNSVAKIAAKMEIMEPSRSVKVWACVFGEGVGC